MADAAHQPSFKECGAVLVLIEGLRARFDPSGAYGGLDPTCARRV